MRVLGLDTSNYTTSAAVFDGTTGKNASRLLDVPPGSLGLRQSDALFQHVKRLPCQIAALKEAGLLEGLAAVGASTRPRAVEESYMPCFLAGESQGRTVADCLGVPFFAVSHQQGHLAAASFFSGHPELMDTPFLAWHLSGGTTELLYVKPEKTTIRALRIGGTEDISAGQLIDRTGKQLGLSFPAGKMLDALTATADNGVAFTVKTRGLSFSLSGMENQMARLAERERPENVAMFVLSSIIDVVERTTKAAQAEYGTLPVLCSGGVASNSLLRSRLAASCGALFAPPEYSADNAMGVAILAHRLLKGGTSLG